MKTGRSGFVVAAVGMVLLVGSLAILGCSTNSSTTTSTTPAATTTALATSATSVATGTSITLTATVAPSAATGTVTFYSGTTSLGTGTLATGTATLSTSFSTAGSYSITATYGGATSYAASTSTAITVTVTTTTSTTPTISMAAVAGGTFYDGVADMTVTGFNISVYPITQAQYQAVVGANPSVSGSGTTNPVDSVNWYQALVFCNLLSIAKGLTPVYTISGSTNPSAWGTVPASGGGANMTWDAVTMATGANGYRLPTSSEYMWAAMGGLSDSITNDIAGGINVGGYLKGYAGSSEAAGGKTNIGNYCWYATNSGSKTQPVGGKLPNELGLYDMCGNVSEWTFDYYWGEEQGATNGNPVAIAFTTSNQTNYTGLVVGTGVWRWMLGGSFEDASSYMTILPTTSYVEGYNPSISKSFGGFRVVTGGAY